MGHPLDLNELERRETEAVRDIAATARYHANRLPVDSDYRQPLLRIAGALPTTPAAVNAPTPESAELAPRGRSHLQVVV